jgi:hypothetical protein
MINLFYYSVYVVCGGHRSATEPPFVNVTHSPVLLISNVEATIATDNVPREISIKNQKRVSYK